VKIVKIHRPCGYAEIDEALFDPRKHTLFIEKAEAPKEPVKKASTKKTK